MRTKYAVPVFYLVLLLVKGTLLQSSNDVEVNDGQTNERDNKSTAITAIIVTAVVCALAAILCIGACAFCCYQKCCIEGLSI